MPVEPIPCAPDSGGGPTPDCDTTTPTATVGLCLADGTPIAVTVVRDCDGAVTSEGWLNLTTGGWTAGTVPAGTVACGDSRSIQVSGTFCAVDDATGEVVGLVLVEYTYDDTGAISAVRLVDAVTGTTYTPPAGVTVTVCPAGVGQTEQDAVVLCHTATDGTITPFLRDYRRDENGAIVGHTDYTLDGAAYTPAAGTVGVCSPAVEPCASTVQVLRLCDLNPDVTPDDQGRRCAVAFLRHLVHDCAGVLVETRDTTMDGVTAYTPVEVVDCGAGGLPAQVELQWPQTGIAEDPAFTTRQDYIYTITNPDTGDTAEVHLHTSSIASTACAGGVYDPSAPVFNNPTVYTLTLDAVAQQMTTFRLDFLDLDPWEGITQLTPPPDRVEGDVTWSGSTVSANAANTVASLYWDNPPAQISYRQGNTGGGLACSVVSFQGTTLKGEGCCGCDQGAEQPSGRVVVERCGCDDVNGDGSVINRYVELWSVDPTGAADPALIGTWLDGDFEQPYTPANPVDCPDGGSSGAGGTVLTGVRSVTGITAQDLAAQFPTLQSVTLIVQAGVVRASMSDGVNVPIPAGVSMTWSVAKAEDSALAAAAFAGTSAAASYLLNWTYR